MMRAARWASAICVAVALLAGVAAGFGVFVRGDGSATTVTSPRGESYELVTTGVYAFNAERVVAEGVGWDVFTLFAAVPALLVTAVGVARSSLRARLIAIGLLGYFFYQYLMYAMAWAFGPLLPVFIGVFALAGVGIVTIAASVDVASLPALLGDGYPRRGIALLCWVMAALLTAMWAKRIVAGLTGEWGTAMLLGQTTMVVQAMDLGLIVPLAIATGAMVWNSRPWGYLLASVFMVKAVAMATAICAMLVSAALVEGAWDWVALAIFGGAAVAAAIFAARIFRGVPRAGLSR